MQASCLCGHIWLVYEYLFRGYTELVSDFIVARLYVIVIMLLVFEDTVCTWRWVLSS